MVRRLMSDLILHVERGDPEEASDLALAHEIQKVLQKVYPNHYWIVGFQGGGMVVRHVAIANAVTMATGKEGFSSLLPREKLGTPRQIRDTAIKFGGALLEAFGLARGPWTGEMPVVPPDLLQAVWKGQLEGMRH